MQLWQGGTPWRGGLTASHARARAQAAAADLAYVIIGGLERGTRAEEERALLAAYAAAYAAASGGVALEAEELWTRYRRGAQGVVLGLVMFTAFMGRMGPEAIKAQLGTLYARSLGAAADLRVLELLE